MKDFDVIIIGAGPAATAAAIHGATQQLKIAIVERELLPRERPGETLAPGLEPLFKQLGVLEEVESQGFIRHPGIHIQWDNPELAFQPYQSNRDSKELWYGYQAYRATLDSILLKRAEQLGVSILSPARASGFVYTPQTRRICGLTVNGKTLYCHYIIDASGNWHYGARQLRIPIQHYSKKLYSRYGYVEGRLDNEDGIPTLKADPDGWTWTALIAKNLYQWTRMTFDGKPPEETFIPEVFKNFSMRGKSRSADVTWRMVTQLAGNGCFMVGDAAAVLDPASSHGVLRAIMSGIKAADLIAGAHFNLCEEEVAEQEYTHWFREWFGHDLQNLHELYLKIEKTLWKDPTEQVTA